MIKKFYDKCPILYGILYGQGLFIFFVLLEYFLVSTGISECGVVTDSFIRIMFGIFALILMKKIHQDKFREQFVVEIPKSTWLFVIPFFAYLGLQFLYLPIAENLTTAYICFYFILWSTVGNRVFRRICIKRACYEWYAIKMETYCSWTNMYGIYFGYTFRNITYFKCSVQRRYYCMLMAIYIC